MLHKDWLCFVFKATYLFRYAAQLGPAWQGHKFYSLRALRRGLIVNSTLYEIHIQVFFFKFSYKSVIIQQQITP
jgi:hypothetical protein